MKVESNTVLQPRQHCAWASHSADVQEAQGIVSVVDDSENDLGLEEEKNTALCMFLSSTWRRLGGQ